MSAFDQCRPTGLCPLTGGQDIGPHGHLVPDKGVGEKELARELARSPQSGILCLCSVRCAELAAPTILDALGRLGFELARQERAHAPHSVECRVNGS